ncbi:MAG TPA: phytanoyl-CoA dioxygenase family protein [Rhizomicrobium sp.]|nr:phytanoyl-CoA dioxygenase family protein [Rhizomicrobium sp.]
MGARTLYQWARAQRSRVRAAKPVDVAATHQALANLRPDLDLLRDTVGKDGIAIVPGYWSADRCAQAVDEMDRLLMEFPHAVQTYSAGADKRMFGVESASALLNQFHADSFLRRFGEMICGLDIYNFATLGARIEAMPGNFGSGEGWHRDAQGFQFKAILYLTDTGPQNGPFEYLIGSHTIWRAAADSMVADFSDPCQTRFTDAEMMRLQERHFELRAFAGKAGTLLLANTAGIHRGMPLKTGARYTLTNYYYHRSEIDVARIQKFTPLVPGTAERILADLPALH